MRRPARQRGSRATDALPGAVVLVLVSLAGAEDRQPETLPRPPATLGALSCLSASCHGSKRPVWDTDGWPGHAPVHWLQETATYRDGRQAYDPRARLVKTDADPHALAGQRMREPRFQEVLKRASSRADGSIDAGMELRCARCHDPLGLTAIGSRGIGCESCHGAAERWIAVHYERETSREHLAQLGMIDTKNLLVRARQCAGCHVGSASQDLNHDMIAAGHPPLRFELASYEALLPRKHWDDRPRRLSDPDYEVRLWAAGRVAAAEAALDLLQGRAEAAKRPESDSPWPEFAEASCFACHQPLQRDANQQRFASFLSRKPSELLWRNWNTALASLALTTTESSLASDAPGSALDDKLGDLRLAMSRSLVPDAEEIAGRALAARRELLASARGEPTLDVRQLLAGLAAHENDAGWDELCQQLAALTAARRAVFDHGATSSTEIEALSQRLHELAVELRFESTDSEWPRLFSQRAGMSQADLRRELSGIRRRLADLVEQGQNR